MARILLFGRDVKQLETRQLFLNKLYDSVAVSSLAESTEQATQGNVDLLVLCQTVSQDDVRTVDACLHANFPAAKVLALQGERNAPHSTSGALDGPSVLLQKVAERLQAA